MREVSISWFITSSSPIMRCGVTLSSTTGHGSSIPIALTRLRTRIVSPPHNTTTSARPAWMSSAVVFTNDCGLLPPLVVIPVSRGVMPNSDAMNRAGSR